MTEDKTHYRYYNCPQCDRNWILDICWWLYDKENVQNRDDKLCPDCESEDDDGYGISPEWDFEEARNK